MPLIPPLFFFALFFAFGATLASFIGVVVARLNTGPGFIRGRSRCDACNAPLTSAALLPVISYAAQGGRARCCGARLSPLPPLSELLLGALFVFAYTRLGLDIGLPFMLVALALLLALVLYDLAHQILPFPLLAAFVAASALTGFFITPSLPEFYSQLSVAFGIAGFFALIHFVSLGRAMGLADAPFAFGLALLFGPVALTGFIFSFWIGALVGIALLYRRPRGSRMGVEVPFAPFLAAGFLLAYATQWNIFGNPLSLTTASLL